VPRKWSPVSLEGDSFRKLALATSEFFGLPDEIFERDAIVQREGVERADSHALFALLHCPNRAQAEASRRRYFDLFQSASQPETSQ